MQLDGNEQKDWSICESIILRFQIFDGARAPDETNLTQWTSLTRHFDPSLYQ